MKLLGTHVAELKRMFLRSEVRGRGGGGLLLDAAERKARALGATSMRLDTRHDLVEARRLYAKHDYVEIAPYSDSPHAEHWFEKSLV
ncbi:acetyltransferase (GNAT) family protein [Halopolyspora algeriensis]|uniref:Acetyltransferase (GNAT) family protein n=1 Tax=Halopolyspora algeriensis TaxID=1500506 RepID=A0A368W0F6_9ACTN|nr:acetyltransferase (GNAT) family protein [Halopolyspora algeriensis]